MTVIQCDVCGRILQKDDKNLAVFEMRLPNWAFPRKIYISSQLCGVCAACELKRFHTNFPEEEKIFDVN